MSHETSTADSGNVPDVVPAREATSEMPTIESLEGTINRFVVLANEWKHLGRVDGSQAERTLWECGDALLDALVTEEAFIEMRPASAGTNLFHWQNDVAHVMGEDCPCHPTLIPHAAKTEASR